MKKLTFLFLTILLPMIASADPVLIDGIYYNLYSYNNTAEVTKKTSGYYNGSISIPSSVTFKGNEYTVTSIGYNAFYRSKGLSSVTIPNSVKSIGEDAFSECSKLSSITIPNSVISIGEYAFYGCSGLSAVTIPNSVTSIGDNAFSTTEWYNNKQEGLVYAGKVAYKYKGTMPENTTIYITSDHEKSKVGRAYYEFLRDNSLPETTLVDEQRLRLLMSLPNNQK